jgi:GMP synthase-like glutamine amidotransferase
LVTNTDDSAFAARHADDAAKFRALIQGLRPDWRVSGFDLPAGAFPDDPAQFDGFVIGGSPSSVHDDAPWITRLMALIRDIVAKRQPLFGACFGHQAIAKALGGKVGANPGGWVFGVTETDVVAPASWMQAGNIRVNAAHSEQVLQLPLGAEVMARNPACAVGAYRIGDRVFATQYHPEMTAAFMAALVEEYAGEMPVTVADEARRSLAVPADMARMAGWIIGFFEQAQDSAASKSMAVT